MAATMNGQWAYAVPMDEMNGYPSQQYDETARSRELHSAGQRELRSSSQRRPSDYNGSRSSSQRRPSDYNILSDSETTGTRKASIRASNSIATRKRSRNALKERQQEPAEESVDDSAWIHRDKLAQIEIQEMAEAGIRVRQSVRSPSTGPDGITRSSRSASRSRARRSASKERRSEAVEDENTRPRYAGYEGHHAEQVPSLPVEDEEEQEFDPMADSELRTPEEVAAEQQAARQQALRPSTSRIPISKASPVPVPQTVVDRDSPLPRSQNGGGAWGGAWDELQYSRRARSGSVGSQVLLDEADGTRTPSRPSSSYMRSGQNETSPTKARVPTKTVPISGARKTSGASNGLPHKSRAESGTASKRPLSSSGHRPRPSTSHNPPEGEAPWIAGMYKPDPRLPPDQQMLPTHAKRMMQEQWEKDGKTGTAYDRDFNLLNDEQFQKPQSPTTSASEPRSPDAGLPVSTFSPPSNVQRSPNTNAAPTAPWPLNTTKSDKASETGSTRPGTSGGYKITPTISTPPPIQRSSGSANNTSFAHKPTPRIPDLDEKQQAEPKKGCCCIIM